jgi:hypothetical protein
VPPWSRNDLAARAGAAPVGIGRFECPRIALVFGLKILIIMASAMDQSPRAKYDGQSPRAKTAWRARVVAPNMAGPGG